MKVKKYNIVISYIDDEGDTCSIQQLMANYSIGTWVCYLLSKGYSIVGIKFFDYV